MPEKTEEDKHLTQVLIEQFSLIFGMYEEAIETIPENQWKSGEIEYLIPARLILHAIEAGDYYTTESPEDYLWSKRFESDPEVGDIPTENLPSNKMELEYHSAVRMKIEGWLRKLSEGGLLQTEDKFPWTGSTRLGRALYILAHYRQHFGEVNAELRRRGLPRIKWRSLQA